MLTIASELFVLMAFVLVSCHQEQNNMKYTIIIENKSDKPIYFRNGSDMYSYGIYGEKKIHYITMPLHFDPNSFTETISFDVLSVVNPLEKIEIKTRGDVDKIKYQFVRDNETGQIKAIFDGYLSDVYFLMFYTKEALENSSYTEYRDNLEKIGFAVLGYYDVSIKTVYFKITESDFHIEQDAVFDINSFVQKIATKQPEGNE